MAASLAMMKILKITTDQNYCRFVVVVIPRLSPPLGSLVNYGYLFGMYEQQ